MDELPGRHQEDHYESDYDYRSESPHLKHRHLYEFLMSRVGATAFDAAEQTGQPHVLEVGAGDGAVTERLLALGCEVTGTEMSRHSVEMMRARFGSNERFESTYDPGGDLTPLGDRRFDLILFASVLHHIPDYLNAIDRAVENHLRPGGALISVQDPLWYPRMPKHTLRITSGSYLTWRVSRGKFIRGLKTRMRRRLHGLSEEAPGDAVEYHVVRQGVDEEAVAESLRPRFESVETLPYWSSQGKPQQRLGERLGLANTFALFAKGHHPADRAD
ncbi:MAG: class I SAM-dependent methyltransferase [Actinomycetota bacterium]|nr:class I SAM-dependent methyltransferase [Actinomycetota bacterium]